MARAADSGLSMKRLIQCINDRRIDVLDELFHEDAVMEWPQWGKRVGRVRQEAWRLQELPWPSHDHAETAPGER